MPPTTEIPPMIVVVIFWRQKRGGNVEKIFCMFEKNEKIGFFLLQMMF